MAIGRKWIRLPFSEGIVARQAHVDVPAGTYEREFGRDGFFGPATEMYHTHPPTGWINWEGPLAPRAFNLNLLETKGSSPWNAPLIMSNQALQFRIWKSAASMDHLIRNGDGDEMLFIHEGAGDLYCEYGHMSFRDGDYIVIPRGTAWRIDVTDPVSALMIEATNDSYQLPEKGVIGNHAIFDPGVLDAPKLDEAFQAQKSDSRETRIVIKKRNRLSTVTFPFNPLDAVGWRGEIAPVRLNWRDIRPVVSARYHIPPSAHANFMADRFIIGTFAPRPLESDPLALKVPYFHSDDDVDEVIFIHRGQMFTRDNFGPGMLAINPGGFPHGPQPKAFEIAKKAARKETNEVVVYLDALDPLDIAEMPTGVEEPMYWKTWEGLA